MAQDGRFEVGEGNGSQPRQKAVYESLNGPYGHIAKNRAKAALPVHPHPCARAATASPSGGHARATWCWQAVRCCAS